MNTQAIKLAFEPQDPTALLDYEISFADRLLAVAPATIVSLSWSVPLIDGDPAPMSIAAHTEDLPITFSRVRIGGGTLGNTYAPRCALVYSDGEEEVVSFTVQVQNT